MTIRPGEFWVAEISYADGSGRKKRPVLVLWQDSSDYVVAAVTSAPPRSVFDVAIKDWKAAGLKVASTVRLARLDCLEGSLMHGRIGLFSPRDGEAVRRAWSRKFGPSSE